VRGIEEGVATRVVVVGDMGEGVKTGVRVGMYMEYEVVGVDKGIEGVTTTIVVVGVLGRGVKTGVRVDVGVGQSNVTWKGQSRVVETVH